MQMILIVESTDQTHEFLPHAGVVLSSLSITGMKNNLLAALILLFMATGCATSAITSSWVPPETGREPGAYQKILVLGLINEPDRSIREKLEQHLADDLRTLGYVAICACEAFQPNTFYGLSESQLLQQMEENSFDAVLTIVLLSKEKERLQKPLYMRYPPAGNYHRQLWDYYHDIAERTDQSGYYSESTKYFWETNFYDLETHALVYSAQSQSFDPASTTRLAHEYGLLIVKDMVKRNVLLKQSPKLKYF